MPSLTVLAISALVCIILAGLFILPSAFRTEVYKVEKWKILFSLFPEQKAHFVTDRSAKVFLSADRPFLTDLSGDLAPSTEVASFLHTYSGEISGPGYISFISRSADEVNIEITTFDAKAKIEINKSTGQKIVGVAATILIAILIATIVGLAFWKA